MAAVEQPQPARPVRTNPVPSTSTPVNISSQCHLDPTCYVKGTRLLAIEADVVVHPRCRLSTDLGPIIIQHSCILNERCILGLDKELNPATKAMSSSFAATAALDPDDVSHDDSASNLEIRIGPQAYFQSTVKLQPPCTIGDSVLLEAGVTLLPGCSIGAHSKICAGITLPPGTVIPEWTVVYGTHGKMRRKRQENLVEESRLDGMARERHGVETLLKLNATKTLSTTGGGSKEKRASIIRSDSQKG